MLAAHESDIVVPVGVDFVFLCGPVNVGDLEDTILNLVECECDALLDALVEWEPSNAFSFSRHQFYLHHSHTYVVCCHGNDPCSLG